MVATALRGLLSDDNTPLLIVALGASLLLLGEVEVDMMACCSLLFDADG